MTAAATATRGNAAAANSGPVTATIVLLPGDGVGPAIVRAARAVLEAVAKRYGHTFKFENAHIGGAAIDATGVPLPPETLELCRAADAVLLGAVGGPKWDNPRGNVRPEQGLLGIRQALGLFANVRPVAPWPTLAAASPLKTERLEGVDLVVVRELTGGIYFGDKQRIRTSSGERASDLCAYSTEEIERIVRVAAGLARGRRRRVTSVDKANVLETSRLWRETATRVLRDEFPDIQVDHMLVDTAAMRLVTRPADFDVVVTENMFGDILTDEAAVLAGSIGLLPSASLGPESGHGRRFGLYEPIHGSAPDIADKDIANPIGTILSAAMLLRHSLGLEAEARVIEEASRATVAEGITTPDVTLAGGTPTSTTAVAARIAERVRP